jgi:rhodanese-related sulfurtransferase
MNKRTRILKNEDKETMASSTMKNSHLLYPMGDNKENVSPLCKRNKLLHIGVPTQPHKAAVLLDSLDSTHKCLPSPEKAGLDSKVNTFFRSPSLHNRSTKSRRSLAFSDESILQISSCSNSKEQHCLNESNGEQHLLHCLKLDSPEALLSNCFVPTVYSSNEKHPHLYCKLNFSSPESTESNLVTEKYMLSPDAMPYFSPSGPIKTSEQLESTPFSDSIDYDFTTCKRAVRENFDEYYTVKNTNHCGSQRQTHALFGDRKNKCNVSNLVLPEKMDADNIDSIESLHEANLIPDPVLSPFNDISPGIICSSTIFDIPGSENYLMKLPSLPDATNRDCNSISPETMIKVLRGEYGKYLVIDCRFPFEYNGGHIKNAINIFEPDALESLLLAPQNPSESLFVSSNVHISPSLREQIDNLDEQLLTAISKDPKNLVIIFHCEFSQKRGPKMYRHLRELDRQQHADTYPELYYPNIYILEGGYKGFWQYLVNSENHEGHGRFKSSEFCIPDRYTSMDDNNFIEEKKKSWNLVIKAWKRKKMAKTFSIRSHNCPRF